MSDRLLSTDLLNVCYERKSMVTLRLISYRTVLCAVQGLSGKGVENILVWTKRKRPNDVCEKVITKDCEQARPSKSVIKKQEQIRVS